MENILINLNKIVPQIKKQTFLLRSSIIKDSSEKNCLISNTLSMKTDLKNRIITDWKIVEPTGVNIYNILNNLFSDKDIAILLKFYEYKIESNNKLYYPKFPHILFDAGQVTSHLTNDLLYNDDYVTIHNLTIKFNKLSFKLEEVSSI